MATVRDIAKIAKVSVGTVSKALHDQSNISDATKEKIWQIAAELDYKKRLRFHEPRPKKNPFIGFIVPDVSNQLFGKILSHAEIAAERHGYMLTSCSTNRDPNKEARLLEDLIQRNADGIIIFAPSELAGKVVSRLEYPSERLVALDQAIEGVETNLIISDNTKGTQEACEHLVKLGHKKIAIITGPLTRNVNHERLKSFKEMMENYNIPVNPYLIKESTFEYEGGYHFAWELLQSGNPPTAIFAFNDLMAFGAINAIFEKGLRVPDDISVVGFDDIPMSQFYRPSLTTVRQAYNDMGVIAVERIAGFYNPKGVTLNLGHGHSTLATRLIIRNSTGPVAS